MKTTKKRNKEAEIIATRNALRNELCEQHASLLSVMNALRMLAAKGGIDFARFKHDADYYEKLARLRWTAIIQLAPRP